MAFKQAARLYDDGAIGIERVDEHHLRIYVNKVGGMECITVSYFNAARIFGSLTLFLGIKLPKAISKAIKM